jgi:acetyl-CoA C-acetyltransferase
MAARDVVILGAARTPIGRYGGSLKDVHPAELGAVAARAALERAAVPVDEVDEVIIGHARQAGSGPNPGRQVAHRTGIPVTAPAYTVNKACASGMQALAAAAQSILQGESDCVVAGGIESMSRMPYLVDSADARWGHRMGHFTFVDAMYRDGFQDPLSGLVMGETAEVLARQYRITREASDQFAAESQQKAEAAQKAGYFTREIAPVASPEGASKRGASSAPVDSDEHPRHGTTVESLARLPLVFPSVEGHAGIITAGSSSGITDGGAALVLASDRWAADRGLKPLARRRDRAGTPDRLHRRPHRCDAPARNAAAQRGLRAGGLVRQRWYGNGDGDRAPVTTGHRDAEHTENTQRTHFLCLRKSKNAL